jgi:hypothetical protein
LLDGTGTGKHFCGSGTVSELRSGFGIIWFGSQSQKEINGTGSGIRKKLFKLQNQLPPIKQMPNG